MSKLSKLLLDTIQSRKITPRSKWYFTTMHTVLWSVFCVAVLIGTLAISLLFLEMTIPERHYMQWVSLPGTMRILPYLPLLWGLGALICVAIAYCVFYKTDRGYRISTLWIVSILILGSFSGGYALHQTKINTLGEKQLQRFVPPYGRMRAEFRQGMPLPESGILPGKIESISDDGYIIQSPDKKIWKVSLNCTDDVCKETKKNLKKDQPMLFKGKIKKEDEKRTFEAINIDTSVGKGCRKNKKDAPCGRALLSP